METEEKFKELCANISKTSDALGEAAHDLYKSYIEVGFTEDQAFELLKSNPIEINIEE